LLFNARQDALVEPFAIAQIGALPFAVVTGQIHNNPTMAKEKRIVPLNRYLF
jgi:hypothetical protein